MNRAERRRQDREKQIAKTATYNYTKEQLDRVIEEALRNKIAKVKQEATDNAVNTAMILLLTLPLEVLKNYYWTKSYADRLPEFTKRVLDYYEMWQDGKLDMDKLREDLWEYGGIRLEEES